MRLVFTIGAVFWAGAVQAMTVGDLHSDGYRLVECRFTERCLIGQPCERAWRDMRWHLNDDTGLAFREQPDGRLKKALLMQDARWENRSDARAILIPMREAVAGLLTIFDGGGAIYALQYAANPGSGQFLRGSCATAEEVNP